MGNLVLNKESVSNAKRLSNVRDIAPAGRANGHWGTEYYAGINTSRLKVLTNSLDKQTEQTNPISTMFL